MVGETLAARYRFTEKLSGGEVLCVYAAVDLVFGTEVEIDVIRSSMDGLAVPARRLEEILDSAMLVRGPYVCRTYGWGEEAEEGFVYVVREKAEGASLAEVLSGTGQLPVRQVAEITAAAVEVLAEAYGRELFYLGLNPGQVLLDGRAGIKLLRAGFAWLLEDMEPLLTARVSPYRAPETDGGKEGSRNSDVYALAVMVREMLPPGEGSPRLDSLLAMAVDPIPKRRPSSPRLLLEELDAVCDPGTPSPGGYSDKAGGEEGCGGTGRADAPGLAGRGGRTAPSYVSLRRKPRRGVVRHLLLMLGSGLLLWLVIAAVAGVLTGRSPGEAEVAVEVEEKVTLPDLQGLTAGEAEEVLEGLGLICVFREAPSRLWSAGRVIAQEPGEGSSLQAGGVVCLVVSTGREGGGEAGSEGTGEDGVPAPHQNEEDAEPSPAALPSPGHGDKPAARREITRGNAPPRAVPVLSSRSGAAPLYVLMDASASYDPDGRIVAYVWHCGDGTVLHGVTAQHVYDPAVIPARFHVVLEVFDSCGLSHAETVIVEVY